MTPKLYKAAEVCEATGLQPYVLRSWEKEFPGIGVQRSSDSPRLYRESDVEQVRRIKELVFAEGLTLAGARRRLEEAVPRRADERDAEIAEVLDALGADVHARIAVVRDGLRSILDVLSKTPGAGRLSELRPIEPGRNGSRSKKTVARKRPVRAKRPTTKGKRRRPRT